MTAQYLNVDLDIRSKSNLDSLLIEMGRKVAVMHCGPVGNRYLLAVETAASHKDPDSSIHGLCDIIEEFSRSAREMWDDAVKQFDVGFEWKPRERASNFSLRPDTLQRMAKLGATLTVTHYRHARKPGRLPRNRPSVQPAPLRKRRAGRG
ncbi:MAG TPA: hypothetical protein VL793_07970 [Patescibacteria group bacterium]|jgi:hypothetical protein|nr:hypothetical protein [Patescibacteria group bacterium]